jgi:hypothetical protein
VTGRSTVTASGAALVAGIRGPAGSRPRAGCSRWCGCGWCRWSRTGGWSCGPSAGLELVQPQQDLFGDPDVVIGQSGGAAGQPMGVWPSRKARQNGSTPSSCSASSWASRPLTGHSRSPASRCGPRRRAAVRCHRGPR